MKTFVVTFIFLALLSASAVAEHVFDLRPTDKVYLSYYVVENLFDSTATTWEAGEFVLHGANSFNRRVHLNSTPHVDTVYQADTVTGESQTILSTVRTESFDVPTSPSISFFRKVQNTILDPDMWGGHWDISERSEFVLQLIRDSDNAVLACLDSCGTDSLVGTADSSQEWGAMYGSGAITCLHTVTIGAAYGGTHAHIRLSARRYGQGALGFSFRRDQLPIPLSRWSGDSCRWPTSSAFIASVWNERYDSLCAYVDSLWTESCALPSPVSFRDSAQEQAFFARYLTMKVDTMSGDTFYLATSCGAGFPKKATEKPAGFDVVIAPNPSSARGPISISVPVVSSTSVVNIAITDLLGRNVTGTIRGFSTKSPHQITFDASPLPSGQYVVTVKLETMHATRMLFVRK
jgi:hypothetical protein